MLAGLFFCIQFIGMGLAIVNVLQYFLVQGKLRQVILISIESL